MLALTTDSLAGSGHILIPTRQELWRKWEESFSVHISKEDVIAERLGHLGYGRAVRLWAMKHTSIQMLALRTD